MVKGLQKFTAITTAIMLAAAPICANAALKGVGTAAPTTVDAGAGDVSETITSVGSGGTFTGSTALASWLYEAFKSNPTKLRIPSSVIGSSNSKTAFALVGDAAEEACAQNGMMDHVTGFSYTFSQGVLDLTIDYADKNAANRQAKGAAVLKKAKEIVASVVKPGMTDMQKATALYDYLSANTKYDYSALNDYVEQENGALVYVRQTAYSALCEGKAICQGFAKAYKLLCDEAQIPCIVFYGTTKRAGGGGDVAHAWNRVYLDGAWRTVDSSNRQLNICAQNGIIISDETAKGILVPGNNTLVDSMSSKYANP